MTLIRTATGIVNATAPTWLYKLLARENLGRGMKLGPEDVLGIEVGDNLRAWALEGRLHATFTHVPHEVGGGGGRLSQVRYALAKALGLITGSGDYALIGSSSVGGGWIELKRPGVRSADGKRWEGRAGTLSPEQKLFRDWCVRVGARYATCHSLAEVKATLIGWGMLDA